MDLPIGAVADVASKALDLAKVREGRNNTDEMKANAEANTRQEVRDKILAAVESGNLEEIRKLAAEL